MPGTETKAYLSEVIFMITGGTPMPPDNGQGRPFYEPGSIVAWKSNQESTGMSASSCSSSLSRKGSHL